MVAMLKRSHHFSELLTNCLQSQAHCSGLKELVDPGAIVMRISVVDLGEFWAGSDGHGAVDPEGNLLVRGSQPLEKTVVRVQLQ